MPGSHTGCAELSTSLNGSGTGISVSHSELAPTGPRVARVTGSIEQRSARVVGDEQARRFALRIERHQGRISEVAKSEEPGARDAHIRNPRKENSNPGCVNSSAQKSSDLTMRQLPVAAPPRKSTR